MENKVNILELESGAKYVGNIKDGLMHGFGTLYYQNGDKYIGNFEYNNLCGFGTMYYQNGVVFAGYWVEGQQGFGRYFNLKKENINDKDLDIIIKNYKKALQQELKDFEMGK